MTGSDLRTIAEWTARVVTAVPELIERATATWKQRRVLAILRGIDALRYWAAESAARDREEGAFGVCCFVHAAIVDAMFEIDDAS